MTEGGAKLMVSGHIYALVLVVPGTKSELPIEQETTGHHCWSGRFGEDRFIASAGMRTKIIFRPGIYH